jgi:hypothetical protein
MSAMDTSHNAVRVFSAAIGLMLLAFAVALTASCRGADQVAPEGFTINVAANPATIVLVNGSGTSDVVATVSSAVGVPQKDIDVRFSASAGQLTIPPGSQPAANIPIRTDNLGNAHVVLTTNTTTTVTARSGTATGTLSLTTVNGNLNTISINQDTTSAGCLSSTDFGTCSDVICVTAQATDVNGVGIGGVLIVFSLVNSTSTNGKGFAVSFTPQSQVTTDSGGNASTSFKISSNTCVNCTTPDSCDGFIQAALTGGAFATATPLHFTANIH